MSRVNLFGIELQPQGSEMKVGNSATPKEQIMYQFAYFKDRVFINPLFENARSRARYSKIKSILRGRSRRLVELEELIQNATIVSQYSLGIQTVCIHRIQGTEGRNTDFDCEFNPLKNSDRDRWINIASARLQEVGLPTIDLIQVGDTYYVRDGHHRISVARALGADFIDANVTVLEITL
jgi:hypothetical protein